MRGRNRQSLLLHLDVQVREVARILLEHDLAEVPVRAAVCFVGGNVPVLQRQLDLDGRLITWPCAFGKRLSLEGPMDDDVLAPVLRALEAALPRDSADRSAVRAGEDTRTEGGLVAEDHHLRRVEAAEPGGASLPLAAQDRARPEDLAEHPRLRGAVLLGREHAAAAQLGEVAQLRGERLQRSGRGGHARIVRLAVIRDNGPDDSSPRDVDAPVRGMCVEMSEARPRNLP